MKLGKILTCMAMGIIFLELGIFFLPGNFFFLMTGAMFFGFGVIAANDPWD